MLFEPQWIVFIAVPQVTTGAKQWLKWQKMKPNDSGYRGGHLVLVTALGATALGPITPNRESISHVINDKDIICNNSSLMSKNNWSYVLYCVNLNPENSTIWFKVLWFFLFGTCLICYYGGGWRLRILFNLWQEIKSIYFSRTIPQKSLWD